MPEGRKVARRKASVKRAPASQRTLAKRTPPKPKTKRPAQGRAASRGGAPRKATSGPSRTGTQATKGRARATPKTQPEGRETEGRPATTSAAGLAEPAIGLTAPTPPAKLAAARRRRTLQANEAKPSPPVATKTADLPSLGRHSARFAGVRDAQHD